MNVIDGLAVLWRVFPEIKLHLHEATDTNWERTVQALHKLAMLGEPVRCEVIKRADELGLWVDRHGCVSCR